MISSYNKFLLEFKQYVNPTNRLLNKLEIKTITDFLNFLNIIFNMEKFKTEEEYNEFKNLIKPYSKYGFYTPIENQIYDIDRKLKNIKDNKEHVNNSLEDFSNDQKEILNLLKNNDINKALELNNKWKTFIQDHKSVNVPIVDILKMYNPYKIKSSIFSDNEKIILDFDKDELDAIYSKIDDLDKMFTIHEFPKNSDWRNLVYFIENLSTSHKTNVSNLKNWIDLKYDGNKNYQEMKKLIKTYLHYNDKKLIPEILNLFNKLPEIKKLNDNKKKEVKKVFRGLGFYTSEDGEPTIQEIKKEELKNKYVATSTRYSSALNFAYMRGHLERDRRSDVGFMIEYDTTPKDSIVIDFSIFGSVFGESEILVDATKAKIINIKEV